MYNKMEQQKKEELSKGDGANRAKSFASEMFGGLELDEDLMIANVSFTHERVKEVLDQTLQLLEVGDENITIVVGNVDEWTKSIERTASEDGSTIYLGLCELSGKVCGSVSEGHYAFCINTTTTTVVVDPTGAQHDLPSLTNLEQGWDAWVKLILRVGGEADDGPIPHLQYQGESWVWSWYACVAYARAHKVANVETSNQMVQLMHKVEGGDSHMVHMHFIVKHKKFKPLTGVTA